MSISFRKLHPLFAAEVSPIGLRNVRDRETLERIRAGMDEHAVLVFRDQSFSIQDQLEFAQRLDGKLHTKTGVSALMKNRLGDVPVGDISNVGPDGKILARDDRRRMYSLANRLWHTDGSFQDPAGRYSMLYACVVPPVRSDTQFADMRAAYDALDDEMKAALERLTAHHSIAYSRQTLGFTFSAEEQDNLRGAVHSMIRTNPRTKRRSVYVASHANRVMELPLAEGRLLIWDLMDRATQPHLVYSHEWRPGDLVIWDNLATMHRGTPFDDAKHHRELRRVTTLDVAYELESVAESEVA
ncbi:MAG TPA: TauD/TfdA family dioxygenase [Burkholderiales bacterium]|jgi:alpha-ketoglutarate-dependent 2,4-dichlorophenoxyacetate dioxygenase|nr:TauD/TfdA family dioxygenase [Burkholderiales bacterium]